MTEQDYTKYEWRNGRLYIVQVSSTGSTNVVVISAKQFAQMAASILVSRAA